MRRNNFEPPQFSLEAQQAFARYSLANLAPHLHHYLQQAEQEVGGWVGMSYSFQV